MVIWSWDEGRREALCKMNGWGSVGRYDGIVSCSLSDPLERTY